MSETLEYLQTKLTEDFGPMGCVDERVSLEGRPHSVNLVGASLEVHDWMVVVCSESGLDVNSLPKAADGSTVDLLFITKQVFDDKRLVDEGVMLGVHNDDHNAVVEDGCAYEHHRTEVLEKVFGVKNLKRKRLVKLMLETLHANFETYSGKRYLDATPVHNWRYSHTLDQRSLGQEGKHVLCHDIWLCQLFAPVLRNMFSQLGAPYTGVAQKLGDRQYLESMSRKFFTAYLGVIGNTQKVLDLK